MTRFMIISTQFDTFLVQTLMPLFNSSDEEIQMATLKVMHSLMPKFKSATSADILFAWDYFGILMSPKGNSLVLESVLELTKEFPIEKISQEAKLAVKC